MPLVYRSTPRRKLSFTMWSSGQPAARWPEFRWLRRLGWSGKWGSATRRSPQDYRCPELGRGRRWWACAAEPGGGRGGLNSGGGVACPGQEVMVRALAGPRWGVGVVTRSREWAGVGVQHGGSNGCTADAWASARRTCDAFYRRRAPCGGAEA
jgi:hypothetical protein